MLSWFKFFFPSFSPPPFRFLHPSLSSSPTHSSPPLSSSLISENRWLHTFLPIDAIPPRSCLIYHMAGSLYECWLVGGKRDRRGERWSEATERSTIWQRPSALYNEVIDCHWFFRTLFFIYMYCLQPHISIFIKSQNKSVGINWSDTCRV